MNVRQRRGLGAAGLAFIVLFIVSGSIVPTKNAHTPADQLAAFYVHHQGGLKLEAHLTGLAVFVGIGFYWYLRELLAATPTSRRLSTLGFAGALMFAVSGSLSAGLERTLGDVATHASPDTIQTLHVLSTEAAEVLAGGGVALFLVATGVAVARGRTLPTWIGWLGVVGGVGALVEPDISGLFAGVWTLIISVVLLVVRVAPDPVSPTT
jgi:Domain of unknown function (DUF4386)